MNLELEPNNQDFKVDNVERLRQKVARKVIDMCLDWPGTVAAGSMAAYEVYNLHFNGQNAPFEWPATLGAGIAGVMAYQFIRIPALITRNIYHGKDPNTPAAKSTERILERTEDFWT